MKRFERPNGTPRRREMVRAVDAIAEDAGKKATRVVASKGEYDAIDRAAKHLARTENWMDAYMHFTLCVNDRTAHAEELDLARALVNRSLMALKLTDYDGARRDANGAVELLKGLVASEREGESNAARLMAKALYRSGVASMGLGATLDAVAVLLDARRMAPKDEDVRLKLVECAARVEMTEACAMYASTISEGEMPNPVSPRDGKWLKPVKPESERMSLHAMAQTLVDCAVGAESRWRSELAEIFFLSIGDSLKTSAMRRGFLSGLRAEAYAHVGNHAQAVKDYRVALAYYPAWARAYHGYALAIEQDLVHNHVSRVEVASQSSRGAYSDALIVDAQVASALWMKRALELDATVEEYGREFLRLVAKLSSEIRDVLSREETSVEDALKWLDEDKWENVPEYIRPRPKYYYFYEMMKARIYEHYPELPQPVMDKLLSLDAGELDLLLQYPRAIRGQTEEFLDVYKREGGEYLATYKTPTLTWDEVKALKGKGTQGLLPNGGRDKFAALPEERIDPGSGFFEEKDTDHAMLGASGEDGLTRAELAGLPTKPSLPPDQLRDEQNRLAAAAAQDAPRLPSATPSRETTSSPLIKRIDRLLE